MLRSRLGLGGMQRLQGCGFQAARGGPLGAPLCMVLVGLKKLWISTAQREDSLKGRGW